MRQHYEPSSDFLKLAIAHDITLTGSALAQANLTRLIQLMRDPDRSNRDWATMLLAQQELDTPAVRDALLLAASDPDEAVRAEALVGLAWRDRSLALPLVRTALFANVASMPVFEAAEICADPVLIEGLSLWLEPSDYRFLDELAARALAACEQADDSGDKPSTDTPPA